MGVGEEVHWGISVARAILPTPVPLHELFRRERSSKLPPSIWNNWTGGTRRNEEARINPNFGRVLDAVIVTVKQSPPSCNAAQRGLRILEPSAPSPVGLGQAATEEQAAIEFDAWREQEEGKQRFSAQYQQKSDRVLINVSHAFDVESR